MSADDSRERDLESFRSLNERMTSTGEWWIPGDGDHRVPGTLRFDPHTQSFRLSLLGSIHGVGDSPRRVFEERAPSVIVGQLFGGTLATLADPVRVESSFGASQQVRENYSPSLALLGLHATDPYNLPVAGCRVRIGGVERWMGLLAYSDEIIFVENTPVERVLRRPWVRPPLFSAILPSLGAVLRIVQGHTEPMLMSAKVSARAFATFCLDYESPVTFRSLFDHLHGLRLALFLLTGKPLPLADLTIRVEDHQPTDRARVLLLPVGSAVALGPGVDAHIPTMDLAGDSAACHAAIVSYFGARPQMEPVAEALLTAESTDASAQRLLLIAHALEVIHRTYFDQPRIPAGEYRTLKRRMLDGLPKDLCPATREHLASHLGHGNQQTLRERVVDLCQRLDPRLSTTLGANGEAGADFARALADTRNYLTHRSRRGSHVLDGQRLDQCSDLGRALAVTHLLVRLGFDVATILGRLPRASVTWPAVASARRRASGR